MPEEILLLDKKTREAVQSAMQNVLVNGIEKTSPFLYNLKFINNTEYNEKFYEELLTLAEQAKAMQKMLQDNKNIDLKEFTAITDKLNQVNNKLKDQGFEFKGLSKKANIRRAVLPDAISEITTAEEYRKKMEPLHDEIQKNISALTEEMKKIQMFINEHQSVPQKKALQQFFNACGLFLKTCKEKLDKVFVSPKEKPDLFKGFEKVGSMSRFASGFASLQNTVKSTAEQAQAQAQTLKRKASSVISNENKENEPDPAAKRPALMTSFQVQLKKKLEEIQAKKAEKDNAKPPSSPSP